MKYLKLELKGPLQYYYKPGQLITATSSVYYKTAYCPTKSAVIGMIGAACGYTRGDEGLHELYSNLTIKYKTVEEGTILVDFQTVRPLDKKAFFVNIKGEKKWDPIIKKVEYLQDYTFWVYIGSKDDAPLDYIIKAFNNPRWQPHLGRRSCPSEIPMIPEYLTTNLEDESDVYDCP